LEKVRKEPRRWRRICGTGSMGWQCSRQPSASLFCSSGTAQEPMLDRRPKSSKGKRLSKTVWTIYVLLPIALRGRGVECSVMLPGHL
jgi:hypothetical protein